VSLSLLLEEAWKAKPAILDKLIGQRATAPIVHVISDSEKLMDGFVVQLLVFGKTWPAF
jgi:hypothetical protein